MRIAISLLATLVLAAFGAVASAQGFPNKTIRFIVPYAPGGSTDIVARLLAQKLSAAMGQQVVVDNRPGAGGSIGADLVAKSPPDGYTMVTAVTGIMAINQFLYRKLPYDPEKDFAPVTQVGSLPDLPTVAESGVPGYEAISWAGVAVPAGTPNEIVGRLHAEIVKVLAMPDIRERFLRDGIDPVGSTPEQFAEHIRRVRIKWAKVVKDSGARAD